MASLDGKVALVTGGGTGIGSAIAETFAGAGACVVVTGRRSAPLAQTVHRVTDSGGTALAVCADVTDLAAMTAAAQKVLDRFGRLDIVVANAGIMPDSRPVLEYPPEDWRRVLDVNLTGVWNTAKVSVPALVRGGGGWVIVIGSGMARVSTGGAGAYAVAKAGASALTRVLAAELREFGIAVNELVPGPTRTPGMGGGDEHDGEAERRWADRGEWFKEPAEVARLALFVAELPARGPTGQTFSLAGRLLLPGIDRRTARARRLQTPTTPSNAKSLITTRVPAGMHVTRASRSGSRCRSGLADLRSRCRVGQDRLGRCARELAVPGVVAAYGQEPRDVMMPM